MSDYKVGPVHKTVEWFIDTVLVGEIKKVVDAGAGYVAFSLIASGIETLGALLDEKEFHDDRLSEERFKNALRKFFPRDYAPHINSKIEFFLYQHLRCGLVHVFCPEGRIAFIGAAGAAKMGVKHLQIVEDDGYRMLVLVTEDFFQDFTEACRKAKVEIGKKTHRKLKQGFVSLFYRLPEPLAPTDRAASPAGEQRLKFDAATGVHHSTEPRQGF